MKLMKRYFKDNKRYFQFVRKHPELKVETVYMTKKSIVAIISKRRGRPRQIGVKVLESYMRGPEKILS